MVMAGEGDIRFKFVVWKTSMGDKARQETMREMLMLMSQDLGYASSIHVPEVDGTVFVVTDRNISKQEALELYNKHKAS